VKRDKGPETDGAELVAIIRYLLGLQPLPLEPREEQRFTLDGERMLTIKEWGRITKLKRTTIMFRRDRLQRHLREGRADAYRLAMAKSPQARHAHAAA
jgi:hypothetical protein